MRLKILTYARIRCILLLMSSRLKDVVKAYLSEKGETAKAQLAVSLKRHQATIERWIRDGVPSAEDAYSLALACGCSEEDALELAKECILEEAKESA